MRPIIDVDDDRWLIGRIGPYRFEIKHYEQPSTFGIDGGRISKMRLTWKDKHGLVAAYDRGDWDKLPETDEAKQALEIIYKHWN